MVKSAWVRRVVWGLLSRMKVASYLYKYRNSYRLEEWKEKSYQFIHVPKCAGTSIVKSLNVDDPGHYSYQDLISRGVIDAETPVFAVVRNPVDRVLSTFSYAKRAQEKNGPNPLGWIAKYSTADDFVLNGLKEKDVCNNYFLNSSYSYVKGCSKSNLIIIDFYELENDFGSAMGAMGLSFSSLTKENASSGKKNIMSDRAKAKIRRLYADDYELMADHLKVPW